MSPALSGRYLTMKPLKGLFVTASLAALGGCVVAPVDPGYYAGPQVSWVKDLIYSRGSMPLT